MLIGIKDYYPLNFTSESDGLVENGNLRFLELWEKGKNRGIYFEEYNKKRHNNYELVILANEPRLNIVIPILIRNIFLKKKNIFYMGDETPISRPRNSLRFPFIYKKILINTIGNKKLRRKPNYFLYTSASIPDKDILIKNKNFILKGERKKLLCYVGSNKLCISNKGSYRFRNRLLQGLSKNKNFSLFGYKWDETVIPIDFPFIFLVNRLSFIKNLIKRYYKKRYPIIKSEGIVNKKIDTTNNFKFTLSIEPYIASPKMVLDKIFDPMLAGSIPVYYGPKDIDIPDDVYIRINQETNPKELIEYLQSIKEEELKSYRERIYEFLISEKSNKFRYSYFANQVLDFLEKNT